MTWSVLLWVLVMRRLANVSASKASAPVMVLRLLLVTEVTVLLSISSIRRSMCDTGSSMCVCVTFSLYLL